MRSAQDILAEPAPEMTSLTSSIFLPVSFSHEITAAVDTTAVPC